MGYKERNRGQVLVFFAIALVVLIGLAALGIDVGYMYSVRHDLQRCADAGALAGASRFINAPGETGTWADAGVQNEARARATDYASRDDVVKAPLLTQPGDSVIVTFDQGVDKIKVQTERTVPLFFSKLFLGATKRITAYAVAEAASISQNTTCLAPFGVPLPWLETTADPTDDDHWKFNADQGDTVYWPENKEDLDNLCNSFSPSDITHWDYQAHDNSSVRSARDSYLCPGTLMNIKIGDPKKAQEPGHFYALDFSGIVTGCPPGVNINSGANFYKFMIKNKDCETGCQVSIDTSQPLPPLDVEPGNMVGPTTQAVAPDYYKEPLKFIGAPPDWDSLMNGRADNFDPSDYDVSNYMDSDADWDYSVNAPKGSVTTRRIIEVPIYDPNNPPPQGSSQIQPVAFAGFWIQDIDEKQGTIVARVISIKGSGMGGPGPGPGGAVTKTIRLVE